MEFSRRISLAPTALMVLWIGAVPPLAVGLRTGGLAAALGAAFAAACPLLILARGCWPVRAARWFPLYFLVLFVVALTAFEFNSVVFLVDTWSALLLGVFTVPVGRAHAI